MNLEKVKKWWWGEHYTYGTEIEDHINWLISRVEEVEEILGNIITTDHCMYKSDDKYSIGVAHGHRCAANMARKAWEDKP